MLLRPLEVMYYRRNVGELVAIAHERPSMLKHTFVGHWDGSLKDMKAKVSSEGPAQLVSEGNKNLIRKISET